MCRGRALLLVGVLAGLLTEASRAHTTFLPHHGQDFADLATGRDQRGVVLVITLGFLGGLMTLGAFVFRQSRQPKVVEDTHAAQKRLKETLIQVAVLVRPVLGKPEREVLCAVVNAYARLARTSPTVPLSAGETTSFQMGTDSVSVRYVPPVLEIVAVSESGGARLALSEGGDFSIGTFVPRASVK